MDNQQPEFVFNLAVPVFKPSQEEIEAVSNTQNIEPFLARLVKSGYLTTEELAAFIRFTLQLSGFTPFLMDEFLSSYRNQINPPKEVDILKPPKKKIITPS